MASYVNNIVYSITPSQNQMDVSLGSSVVVVFNTDMKSSTLNAQTISLTKGSTPVAASYSFSGINKELTITPTASLVGDQTYKLFISTGESGPQTAFGNLSNKEYVFYFTTEAVVEEVIEDSENLTEETTTETETPVDNFSEEDLFDNLRLLDSYPKSGDLVAQLSDVVLSFDEDVNIETVASFVYLREQPISPLLSHLSNANKITLSLNASSTKRAIILTPSTELRKGTAYDLVIKSNVAKDLEPSKILGMDVVVPFQMQWELFYTSVSSVQLLLGLFAQAYSDAQIATMIHQESLGTYQLMSMKTDFDITLWTDTAPYAATQYILYRTAYQAMLGQIIENSSGMKQSIKLGDLSVAESSSVSSEVSGLLGLFEKEMNKWWNLLNGVVEDENGIVLPKLSTNLGSATRGITDSPYPEWLGRVPFTDLGG